MNNQSIIAISLARSALQPAILETYLLPGFAMYSADGQGAGRHLDVSSATVVLGSYQSLGIEKSGKGPNCYCTVCCPQGWKTKI